MKKKIIEETELNMQDQRISYLETENSKLLSELETAYKNMATILEQSEIEMQIAYNELDERYNALENLYRQLSNKENMLIHMEKLSSIGQFISEIIHELNNPLAAISGLTDLVLMDESLSEKTRERLSKIPIQVKRMNNYLTRFKGMAYKGKEDFTEFDLNDCLKEFLATLEIISPKKIVINSEICDAELIVNGDRYQLVQIFLNLAKNAFDAMENKGTSFTVTSRKIPKSWLSNDSNICSISSQTYEEWMKIVKNKSEFALIEFKDNGSGIPKEIMGDIFDAFFTTKERGKGTGLGLSIATDITKRHNSNLFLKSKIGEGTTFQFVMPLV